MKINYLFLFILTFILFGHKIFAQDNPENLNGSVKIVYAKISYEGNVTVYKFGNTRVYPPQKIPVEKRSYKGIFRVELSGDEFVIEGPLNIKCYLSNGDVIVRQLNPELKYFHSNELYEVTFDFNTDETLFGETKVELLKSKLMSPLNNSNNIYILDKTSSYIQ